MQPCLIYGGSSRKQRDYVSQVAKDNNWNFYQIEADNWESELYKFAVTSNLYNTLNLIYLPFIEKLKESELNKLLTLIEDSPHRYIFSTRAFYKLPKDFRFKCHSIKTGEVEASQIFLSLQKLMTEDDRDKVREFLKEKDVEALIHILKNNIWRTENPKVWYAVENCLNLMYKVNKEYLVSILSYLFPKTKIILSSEENKEKLYKTLYTIIVKIKAQYKVSTFEALETINMIKEVLKNKPEMGSDIARELKLGDNEIVFFGVDFAKKEPVIAVMKMRKDVATLEGFF